MTLLLAWILGGPGARRVVNALVAAVAVGLVVHGLLATGEPAAGDGTPAGRPTQAQAAPAPSARRPQAKAPATTGPATTGPAAKAPASSTPRARPAAAAAHWYAKRHGLPASRVRLLQVDQVDPTTVRVLVLVTKRGGGLDSAVVTVRRDGTGWVVRNP